MPAAKAVQKAYLLSAENPTSSHKWRRQIAALVLFGAAFGYLEAAVVSYLRVLHESARQRFHPEMQRGDLFPLLTREQVRDSGESKTLAIEIGREAATIVMLSAIALAVATDLGQWTAAFVIAFGVWDITFYLFLRLLLGWPASLLTWDILFLIPVPWVAPVIAPVLVASAMIAGGLRTLWLDAMGRRQHLGAWNVAGIIAGALVIILSFTLDYPNISAGGSPNPFHWGVFGSGLAIAAGSALVNRGRVAARQSAS
jgi:hypothetical protein